MCRTKNIIVLCAGTLLFLWTGAWAQQASGTAPQPVAGQTTSPSKQKKTEKPKKWQGKLVDANCIVKAMNTVAAPAPYSTGSGFPHFAGSASAPAQYQNQGGTTPQQQTQPGAQTGPNPNQPQPMGPIGPPVEGPDIGPFDTAQSQRSALVDAAAKECAATSTTSQFGLLTDSGAVMKFGKSGNSKASQAVKEVELKPKKPVEATVRGLQDNKGHVLVTSVAVKGRHKK